MKDQDNSKDGASPFSTECPNLLQHHFEHLRASGISEEIIRARGYESVTDAKRLRELGFSSNQISLPGILVPLQGVDGTAVGYQCRPDYPRTRKGKPVKYENPPSQTNRIDVNPICRDKLGDPSIDLFVTEGSKKVDALMTASQVAIGLIGVWNWRGKNELGGKTILADFDHIALNGRTVYLAFDSDWRQNPQVSQALKRLALQLGRRDATVYIVDIPAAPDGQKQGVDDFLSSGHTIEELKASAIAFAEIEQAEESSHVFVAHFEYQGRLYLEVRKHDGGYAFAYLEGNTPRLTPEVLVGDKIVRPLPLPEIEGQVIEIVGLPTEDIAHGNLWAPNEIYAKVKGHIARYVDLSELNLELATNYCLSTWFHRKVNTVGYLRFLADTGKGKSRAKKVIGNLCCYPVHASGASSFSGVARTQQRWHGTLVIDEADFGGEKESQLVKYLNLGFERGQYYILSDKKNPRFQEYFDPFGPKVIAMREPFRDNATEGRLLSVDMHETHNPKIPVIVPQEYEGEMRQTRNDLAAFTLGHWHEIDGTEMLSFDDLDIEPRLKQLAMPLSIIFHLWSEGMDGFKRYLVARQADIRRIRSISWQGSLVNLIISLANGDLEPGEEFSGYHLSESSHLQAVTPTMIARQVRSSASTITRTLTSVGFVVEKRHLTVNKDGQEKRHTIRAYAIPDVQTWDELVSRYYYSDDSDEIPDLPDCLRSSKFTVCMEPSQPSQPSQQAALDNEESTSFGTHGTHGTLPRTPLLDVAVCANAGPGDTTVSVEDAPLPDKQLTRAPTFDDNRRQLLSMAEAQGWPRLDISQGLAVKAGEEGWQTFAKNPTQKLLEGALMALEAKS